MYKCDCWTLLIATFSTVPSQPVVMEAWRGPLHGGHDTHVGGDRRRRRGVQRSRDVGGSCSYTDGEPTNLTPTLIPDGAVSWTGNWFLQHELHQGTEESAKSIPVFLIQF